MTQQLWIPGPLPGLNDIIDACKSGRGKSNAYARMKAKWTNDIVMHIRAARLRPVESAYLRFIWRETSKRRNPDNVAAGGRKLILDSLVAAKIIGNDGWNEVAGWNDAWMVDANPGVEVAIFESPRQ
jgi:hypothetical protein